MADYVDTKVSNLVINNLTQEKYDELLASGQINPDELYCTPDNIEEQLNAKADKAEIETQLASKADKSTVEEQLNNKLDKSAEAYLVPSGAVSAFAGTTAPTGWLKCDGSTISRTMYAALFAAIGTKYGAGDGSTTFKLPTQSVLPLGTSANGTTTISRKGTVVSSRIYRVSSNALNTAKAAIMSNESGVPYMNNISGSEVGIDNSNFLQAKTTVNLANATGAQAIVCIKY